MKQTVLAIALTMATGGAFASGGLSIDTVNEVDAKLSEVNVDRSELAQGPVEKFESYRGQMVIVDTDTLRHGSNV